VTDTTTTAPAAETTATTTTAPAAFDWKTSGLDDASMALVTERQWKDPSALVTSYRNLEKLAGVPADKIIKLPNDDSPEAWGQVYDRLGRPKDVKDYGIPGDSELSQAAGKWFHDAGLSVAQARKVSGALTEFAKAQETAATTARTEKEAADVAQLRKDWGPAFDEHANLVDAAAQKFGMKEEQLAALKAAMGPAGAMKFLHGLGTKLGVEGDFVSGGKGGPVPLTMEQARASITNLRRDRDFAARFNSPDVSVRSEARKDMERLQKLAYPELQSL
jgi:hypothetical protein